MCNFVCVCKHVICLHQPSCYACYDTQQKPIQPTPAESAQPTPAESAQPMPTKSEQLTVDENLFSNVICKLPLLIFVPFLVLYYTPILCYKLFSILIFNIKQSIFNSIVVFRHILFFFFQCSVYILMILGCLMILFVSTVMDIINAVH